MSVSYIKTITEITIINNNNIKTIIKKKKGKKPCFFPSLHMQNDVSEVLLPYSIQLQHSEDNDTFRVGAKRFWLVLYIYITDMVTSLFLSLHTHTKCIFQSSAFWWLAFQNSVAVCEQGGWPGLSFHIPFFRPFRINHMVSVDVKATKKE